MSEGGCSSKSWTVVFCVLWLTGRSQLTYTVVSLVCLSFKSLVCAAALEQSVAL